MRSEDDQPVWGFPLGATATGVALTAESRKRFPVLVLLQECKRMLLTPGVCGNRWWEVS